MRFIGSVLIWFALATTAQAQPLPPVATAGSNADLARYATTDAPNGVSRCGYMAPGDSPCIMLQPTTAACGMTAFVGTVATAGGPTTTLNVTSVSSGTLRPGLPLPASAPGVTSGTVIVAQLTGTPGGIGTYSLSQPFNPPPSFQLTIRGDGTTQVASANDLCWQAQLPPGGTLSPLQFGAVGNGTTVDTAAFQACLNAAGTGGTCLISTKLIQTGGYNLAGGITIPLHTTLDCGQAAMTDLTPPLLPSTQYAATLLIDPAHPILFGGTSARIQHCMLSPIGMLFPQASAAGWTGTAIDTNGQANPQIVETTIVGFDTCINTTTNGGSMRPYLHRIAADCAGVTNGGSLLTGNNGDIATVTDIKLQTLGTAPTCPARLRAGTGLKLVGFAWVDNFISTDFQTSSINITNASQIMFGEHIWIDYDVNGGCARGTSVGVEISGADDIVFGHLDIQGVQNAIQISGQGASGNVHIDDLWLNTIGNDGVQLGSPTTNAPGGRVQIDNIRTNASSAIAGYAINIIDQTHSTHLQVGGGSLFGVHGGAAPYISGGNVTASHLAISSSILSDLANPYTLYGAPILTSCTGIGTGACSILNSAKSNPWEIIVQIVPQGTPSANGAVQITWPMPVDNASGCVVTYKAGTTGWNQAVTIQTIDPATNQTQINWGQSVALTVGQTYDLVVNCQPT